MSLLQTVILKLSEEDVEYLNFMVEAGGYESPSELVRQLIQYTREEQTQTETEDDEDDEDEDKDDEEGERHLPHLEALYPLLGVPEAIDENGDPMWRGEQWRAAMERYEQGKDQEEDGSESEPGADELPPS